MKKLVFILFLASIELPGFAQAVGKGSEPKERLNFVSLTAYGLAPVLVYERMVPIGDHYGIIASAGAFYYGGDNTGYTVGTTFYAGSERHKGEVGAVYLNDALTIAYAAYRFKGKSWLYARGGLGYAFMAGSDFDSGVVPILALGYAF